MLKWNIHKNVINQLFFEGENIINPWGAETADSSAFYSQEDGFGYRYSVIEESVQHDDCVFKSRSHVKMYEGEWKLENEAILNGNQVRRVMNLTCVKDSYFMDFVMRFRFKKSFVKKVTINNTDYVHRNTNVYYQYPVDFVVISGINFKAKIEIIDSTVPEGMQRFMYVRDNGDDWIVHVRMLPTKYNKIVIKLCNKWYKTRPIPQIFSNILLKSNRIKDSLWYRGEKSRFKSKYWRFINPAAFPMIQYKEGTKLSWKVNLKIEPIEK